MTYWHRRSTYNSIVWLHGILARCSSYYVGVDMDEKGIEPMREFGYTCHVVDIEKPFDLKMKFYVAIASKVIYYLSDFRTFMDNVKRHLKSHGTLVIAIGTPFSYRKYLRL